MMTQTDKTADTNKGEVRPPANKNAKLEDKIADEKDDELADEVSQMDTKEISESHAECIVIAITVDRWYRCTLSLNAIQADIQMHRILEAVREARRQLGIEICCEIVELNERQLDALCLQPGARSRLKPAF
jgi:hypothetical protein